MERFIAIDKVCAWPNLTRLPNRRIAAVIFNQPCHGAWEGDVECWTSEDEGREWRLEGVAAPHEPTTCRMNVAAGLNRAGELIVLSSGWSDRAPPHQESKGFEESRLLPVWVCRSVDGGREWTQGESVADPDVEISGLIPFGDIVQTADGQLGACMYCGTSDGESRVLFYASNDDGRNWKMKGVICPDGGNETTPVVLPNGEILVAMRTSLEQQLVLFRSSDHGATWSRERDLSLSFQIPGHLMLLEDESLLLSFGLRNQGLYGVGARHSIDGGITWSPTKVVLNLADPMLQWNYEDQRGPFHGKRHDVGYPSSVQCEDGTIVTAYYSNGVAAHTRYHMGVVRWQLGE